MEAANILNFECFICSLQLSCKYLKIAEHFRHLHAMRTSGISLLPLICSCCDKSYLQWNSFRNHLFVCDRVICHVNGPNVETCLTNEIYDPIVAQNQFQRGNNPFPFHSHELEDEIHDEVERKHDNKIALMILNLQAKFGVSHEALNYICKELKSALSPIEYTEAELIRFSLEEFLKEETTYF